MGPRTRYLGNAFPKEALLWQDPVPTVVHDLITEADAAELKKRILGTDLTVPELVRTAWSSASSFRVADMRGGANGARISLAPQKDWVANNPVELSRVLDTLKSVRDEFGKKVSLADVIVLGGAAAVEKAARAAGFDIKVPFEPGRTDATQEMTDVKSFNLLKPSADAFRNYFDRDIAYKSPAEMLVDKADQLGLTVPQMTVLLGGMRSLNANVDGVQHGVLTENPGTLNNDFFVNLLDMEIKWQKSDEDGVYIGLDRKSGKQKYTATPVDLIFGSNSELRAVAEAYAMSDSKEQFVKDFTVAWTKVMQNDRYDLKK